MIDKKLKVVHQNEELKKPDLETPEASSLYEILKELPKPETSLKLTAGQKKWWYWFGLEFVATKQFSKVDLQILQNAAFAMDMKCKLINLINLENKKSETGVGGVVQKFVSGATNITGYQSALKDQIKILDDVSAHFGMSMKDRKKLGEVKTTSPQLDLFDKLYQELNG